jgi:hypothetical protein
MAVDAAAVRAMAAVAVGDLRGPRRHHIEDVREFYQGFGRAISRCRRAMVPWSFRGGAVAVAAASIAGVRVFAAVAIFTACALIGLVLALSLLRSIFLGNWLCAAATGSGWSGGAWPANPPVCQWPRGEVLRRSGS